MKKIYYYLIMFSAYSFIGLILQCLFLSTLFASSSIAQNHYSVKEVELEVEFKNSGLIDVISKIESSTSFKFIYYESDIRNKERFSMDKRKVFVSDLLLELSKHYNLAFKQVNSNITIRKVKERDNSPKLEIVIQAKTVSGKVTSLEDGETLPGVNVVEKGTLNGTVTDIDGNYSIDVAADATLIFSSVGYTSEEVKVNNQSVINMALAADIKQLQELVVIGYGAREKKDVTTSISTMDSDDITKATTMSPEFAMQGRMTGVHVSGNSGNPMDRPNVRIRGVNTWGVSSPLYVIDGVPITELGGGILGQENSRISDVRGPINIMSMINPNDIESISVLKDASAAAIYGVRAANGVILITTKKGTSEKPTINFDAKYGIQNVIKTWDVMNTQQYVDFYKDAFANNPDYDISADPAFDPSSPRYLGNTEETYDWQSPLLNQSSTTQDYAVNISGKTERTNYYASANYANFEGVLNAENLERYSMNLKLDNEVKDWLAVGINYRLAYVEGKDENRSDLQNAAQTPPWQPIYSETGIEQLRGYAPVVVGYNSDGSWNKTKLYGEGTRINDFGRMALNTQEYNSIRNLGNAFIDIKPLEGLSIKGTYSIDWYQHNRIQFTNVMDNYFDYTAGDPAKEEAPNSLGGYGERTTSNYNQIFELTLHYRKAFGDHNFDLVLNGMDQQYGGKYVGGSTELVTTLDKSLWALGGPNEYTTIESEPFRWALQGLMGRLSYNYNYKYYLDLTLRRDGSTRFAPENRWGIFPSASAAWRISAEPFMQSQKVITDLKLRAGWGQLGNQEVRDMAYLSAIEKNPTYALGGNDGWGNYNLAAAMFAFPNPDLLWETTTTTNFGFDAILFDKLNMSFEYYYKKTGDLLQETTIPPSVGSKRNPVANVGAIENSGIELSLNYNNSIGDINYSIGGNLTTVHNEVLSTYNNIPFGTNAGRIEPGYPVGYIYGYKIGGIFQNQAEIDAYTSKVTDENIGRDFAPGDLYFLDVNGPADPENGYRFYTPGPDGVIDENDRVFLGSTIPGYYYGFNLGLGYKGLDFSAFFQGVGDVMKRNQSVQELSNLGTRGNNALVTVLNSWTEENPSTTIPKAIVSAQNYNSATERFNESAAYLRLGNVQLGYTLPQSVYDLVNNNIQSARIYIGVNNAMLFTPWSGLDPENDVNPMPRIINFGLNARF